MKQRRVKPKSDKRMKDDETRSELRRQQLYDQPWCEAKLYGICTTGATDVDEIVTRGARPGAQLEPALFISLCRMCHAWKTLEPKWARAHGLALRQWEVTDEMLTLARQVRTGSSACRKTKCDVDHLAEAVEHARPADEAGVG